MSLVSTYVRATDGKLYRNPILEGDGWFICFDDDDPIELVVTMESGIKEPTQFLRDMGIHPVKLHKGDVGGMRCFGKTQDFKDAKSWFFEINRRIPEKLITKHDGVVEKNEVYQGVFYDPKK